MFRIRTFDDDDRRDFLDAVLRLDTEQQYAKASL